MTRLFHTTDFEIFEQLPHPIWVFDIDREAMWWANKLAVDLWNANTLAELLQRDFTDTSEATKVRLANYRRAFERGESMVEQWTFYPKGEPCVVVCTCSGVRIDDGRIALLIEGRPVSVTDVGPSTLRCVEALHHTSLIISIFSLDGKLLFQNPAACKAFPSKFRFFSNRFRDQDVADTMWSLVKKGQFVSLEAEVETRDGYRWHGIDCKLTRDPVSGGQVILCNQRDLHQLKTTELKLEQAIVKAQKMALIKSRFLANMSHEIRTPLNGVLGMAQLLAETSLSQNQRQYVDHMQDAAQILRTLIDDILDYSKLEAGRLSLSEAPFSLKKCFQSCISLVEPQAQSKGLEFRVRDQSPEDVCLIGDEIRISQVLINMLGNAVKFTPEGYVRFELKAPIIKGDTCQLTWTIADTGVGIAEHDKAKLFTRFTQLDNSLLRGQSGTGLGLAICQELVELMRGDIALDSDLGKGSVFTVNLTLPIKKGHAEGDCESGDKPLKLAHLDVLLVEDNLTNQVVAKRMLARLGHQCRVANNGHEALEEIASKRPDVIFMDVVMPVMDGLTATRKIRELDIRHIPIIALTANAMHEEKQMCLEAKMDDFMAKPLDFKVLAQMLEKWRPKFDETPVYHISKSRAL